MPHRPQPYGAGAGAGAGWGAAAGAAGSTGGGAAAGSVAATAVGSAGAGAGSAAGGGGGCDCGVWVASGWRYDFQGRDAQPPRATASVSTEHNNPICTRDMGTPRGRSTPKTRPTRRQ